MSRTEGAALGRARSAERAARRLADRIEDIIDLRASGVTPAEIARRLGVEPRSIERQMTRWGRPDIAAIFQSTSWASRKRPCADCGEPCGPGATWCRPCGAVNQVHSGGRRAASPFGQRWAS